MEGATAVLHAVRHLLERELERQETLDDRGPSATRARREIGRDRPQEVEPVLARDRRAEPSVDRGGALRGERSPRVDRQEALRDVVEQDAQIPVARVELRSPRVYDLLEADDVVEEAARDEACRDRLEDDEGEVNADDPPRRVVVEHARRQDRPDDEVVERDRHRGREDDERVAEDGGHRQQGEEIEVHLDLDRALTEVHEQAPEEHRGDSHHHRHGPRVLDEGERHDGPNEGRQGQRDGRTGPGFVAPPDEREDGDVRREEERRDAVHLLEVAPLEDGDLGGQDQE